MGAHGPQEATPRDITLADAPWLRGCFQGWVVGPVSVWYPETHPSPALRLSQLAVDKVAWPGGAGPQGSDPVPPLSHSVALAS